MALHDNINGTNCEFNRWDGMATSIDLDDVFAVKHIVINMPAPPQTIQLRQIVHAAVGNVAAFHVLEIEAIEILVYIHHAVSNDGIVT